MESIKEFVGLRAKTYSQLIDNGNKDKNTKDGKKCAIKRKLHYYKSCLEATQLENKMNQLKKNKVYVSSFKESHKEFMKNDKLILKTQRFKTEKDNVFTEEVNNIALHRNDDKRIQSIDSVETYAYETWKDLIYKRKETNCNNVIKQ